MCGRFVLDTPVGELNKEYGLSSQSDLIPQYNIAPSQLIAVVRENFAAQREITMLKWGLIPSWTKEVSGAFKMINARSETVHEKPSFKSAVRSRRCIIPASGFYEWQKQGKDKIPHYIHFKNKQIMSFAGLWEKWTSSDGETIESCAILTTAANDKIRDIHDRMPVILHGEEISTWLSRDIVDTEQLRNLFHPFPSEPITFHQVSRSVNSVANNQAELILESVS